MHIVFYVKESLPVEFIEYENLARDLTSLVERKELRQRVLQVILFCS